MYECVRWWLLFLYKMCSQNSKGYILLPCIVFHSHKNVNTPTQHAHKVCTHSSREAKALLSLPQSHTIRVEWRSPCVAEKFWTCTKLLLLCMLELTGQANEGVCSLCRANSKALPTINTHLIRQCVLLPVLSCLLLHTHDGSQTTHYNVTAETGDSFCKQVFIYLSSIYRCAVGGSSFSAVHVTRQVCELLPSI